jgi:ribosomal protein L11 methylase PrmA
VESAGGVSVQPVVKPSYSTIGSQLAAAELLATTQAITLAQEIQTNPLKMLAPLLAARVAPGGRLALSGVLEAQADEVIEAYSPSPTTAPRRVMR